MSTFADVRPRHIDDIYELDHQYWPKVNLGPIVLHVPERAGRRRPSLYVVIAGWLELKRNASKLLITGCGTEVGYFRLKSVEGVSRLDHVYGGHFDYDCDRLGHPVFHFQVGSQLIFYRDVEALFKVRHEATDSPEDGVEKILKTVRLPSAQMDFFSVITQVFADHLLDENSSGEVIGAFEVMRNGCDLFEGAGHRGVSGLALSENPDCFRATHWYRRKGNGPGA